MNEGDCDSDDECKSHLYCGSNNCPASFGNSTRCCEPKGDEVFLNSYFLIIREGENNVLVFTFPRFYSIYFVDFSQIFDPIHTYLKHGM